MGIDRTVRLSSEQPIETAIARRTRSRRPLTDRDCDGPGRKTHPIQASAGHREANLQLTALGKMSMSLLASMRAISQSLAR
jgi:hypothetical protein